MLEQLLQQALSARVHRSHAAKIHDQLRAIRRADGLLPDATQFVHPRPVQTPLQQEARRASILDYANPQQSSSSL